MPRISRIAGSFAIVVIAYWAYALLAVRWIEPSAALNSAQAITAADRTAGGRLPDLQMKQLRELFPPDAWELQNPMILESDHAKLLLQLPEQYNRPDGWLEIKRCTIIIPYEGPAESQEQRRRQSIILQSPEGALLRFDQPFDISHFKVGRLVDGQMNGQVTIRSDWKEPGPEDDLLITTSKIVLKEQTISTTRPVDFRFEKHSGRGQGMIIKLVADPAGPGAARSGMKFSGIESFELSHVERLHLELPMTSTTGEKSGTMPVDINCRGPFRFDKVQRVATFRDQVEVRKLNPDGPADQLSCDRLSLFFIQPPEKPRPGAKKAPKTAGPFDLVPQRIEATGNPVIGSIQQAEGVVSLRAPLLEYNLPANSVKLAGDRDVVVLKQGPNEIHARSILYQSDGQDTLGQVTADGPGSLHGQRPDQPKQQLDVEWKDKLLIHPRDPYQEIEITGEAKLTFPGVGTLQAPKIYFWLVKTPTTIGNNRSGLQPKVMRACNGVRIDSPQLVGNVWDQLEVWFKDGATNLARAPLGNPGSGVVGTNFNTPAVERLPQSAPAQQTSAQAPSQFNVKGKTLRAQVVLGDQPAVSNLRIDGDVHFDGNGMSLVGPNVEIDGETNVMKMKIVGPGEMQFPPDNVLQGPTPTAAGALAVTWQNRMDFDGRKATFDGAVRAATTDGQTSLETATMEVTLDRPIRLTDANQSGRPQVEKIQCKSEVLISSRSLDQQQQLVSFNHGKVSDLAIMVVHGEAEINAGAGWLNSVSYQSADMAGSLFSAPDKAPANAAKPPDKLYCLHVTFQKSVTGRVGSLGNIGRGQLTFRDRVQAAYGPVDTWDAELKTSDPRRLGPNGFTAKCDQLSVAQTPSPTNGRPSIWLEALDNAKVENIDYTALGKRITYDQARAMVILEGDGRTNAELYRQVQPGATRTPMSAQKLMYSLKTKQGNIVGLQSTESTQFFNGSAK